MEEKVRKLIEKHKKDKDLTKERIEPGWDWSDADLSNFNLKNMELSTPKNPVNFKNSVFRETNLDGVCLVKANLEKTQFFRASLKNANLVGSKLENSNLNETNLEGASLMGVNLKNANLTCAHLQGANIRESSLKMIILDKANLENVNLFKTNLIGAKLWKTNLIGANLREANLIAAFLERTDLRYSDLENADLRLVDMYMCKFQGSNIEYAKLSEKDINEMKEKEIEKNINDLKTKKIVGEEIFQTLTIHTLHHRTFPKHDTIRFGKAIDIYRTIKNTLTQNGCYDLASEYHYKEKRASTKRLFKTGDYRKWTLNNLFRFLCGYGEKPLWIIPWVVFVILFFGTLFWGFNGVQQNQLDPVHPIDNYYFSVVTFTTLGFGDLYPNSTEGFLDIPWFRVAAALEALLGAFLMALFVVVASKRIMR